MHHKDDFDSLLQQRGFDREVQTTSPKRMLAYQIEREMARRNISRVEMAARMKTSRAALNRLLDPENNAATLQTIEAAADVLDMNIIITLENRKTKS